MSRSDLQEPPSADGSCLELVDDGLSWENAYSFGSIHTSVAGAVSSREWFRSRSQRASFYDPTQYLSAKCRLKKWVSRRNN